MLQNRIKQIKKFIDRSKKLLLGDNLFLRKKLKYQYSKLQDYAHRIHNQKAMHQDLLKKYIALNEKYELAVRERYPYCSLTAGNKSFEKKWHNSKGKRILFIAPKDYSGSFMKWAVALNKYSSYAVRLLTFGDHPYGYENDLIFPTTNQNFWDKLTPLLQEADAIHIKDEQDLFASIYGAKKIKDQYEELPASCQLMKYIFDHPATANTPKIYTHYGGYARKFKDDPQYIDYVSNFDAKITMTADLNYPWFKGYFIPHAVNTEKFVYSWQNNQILAHSPSTSARKGTNEFILAVQQIPEFKNKSWKLDLIENVKHQECLERKKGATLFFDQAGREMAEWVKVNDIIGFYGNSALEAMVHGIPTIAHISKQALDGADRANKDWSQCPVLDVAPMNELSMKETIERFIKMNSEEKKQLSLKNRQWIEKYHSFPIVAQELATIYTTLLQKQNSYSFRDKTTEAKA